MAYWNEESQDTKNMYLIIDVIFDMYIYLHIYIYVYAHTHIYIHSKMCMYLYIVHCTRRSRRKSCLHSRNYYKAFDAALSVPFEVESLLKKSLLEGVTTRHVFRLGYHVDAWSKLQNAAEGLLLCIMFYRFLSLPCALACFVLL